MTALDAELAAIKHARDLIRERHAGNYSIDWWKHYLHTHGGKSPDEVEGRGIYAEQRGTYQSSRDRVHELERIKHGMSKKQWADYLEAHKGKTPDDVREDQLLSELKEGQKEVHDRADIFDKHDHWYYSQGTYHFDTSLKPPQWVKTTKGLIPPKKKKGDPTKPAPHVDDLLKKDSGWHVNIHGVQPNIPKKKKDDPGPAPHVKDLLHKKTKPVIQVVSDPVDKKMSLHPDNQPIEHRPSWVHETPKYKFSYIHWDEAAVARFEGRKYNKTSHSSVEQPRETAEEPHLPKAIMPKSTSQTSSQISSKST